MGNEKVVIVGGGITGLTAAYYMQKDHPEMEVTLLEASTELGGKINTIHQNGHIIERGADSILARKKPGMTLLEDLGLTDQLVLNQTGQAYVLMKDKLHKIPAGSYMGIPVSEEAFLESKLISRKGKTRVLNEPSIPKSKAVTDQSLGLFLRDRFGDELIENLLEPLLSGIYSSDIDEMGIMSTFPNFYGLEQKYGSVSDGLRKTMSPSQPDTGKKSGQFVSLKKGLKEIIDQLVKALEQNTIQTGRKVQKIIRNEKGYVLHAMDGSSYEADKVLLTIPHQKVPPLFEDQDVLAPLQQIPVSSVANVAISYDAEQVKSDLNGTGFVVSRNSEFRITACTWTNRKWPHTTPDGKVLFRLYVGKPDDQDIVTFSDDDIVSIVLKDLHKIMDIDGEPDFAIVSRWQNVMPQYTVGHKQIVSQVRESLHEHMPGVYIAGSSYDGVGVPDCIASAEEIVRDICR